MSLLFSNSRQSSLSTCANDCFKQSLSQECSCRFVCRKKLPASLWDLPSDQDKNDLLESNLNIDDLPAGEELQVKIAIVNWCGKVIQEFPDPVKESNQFVVFMRVTLKWTYLIWLTDLSLGNQHYHAAPIRKLRSWTNGFFKIVGFAGKRFLSSFPLPLPALFCARLKFRAFKKRKMLQPCGKPYGNACYARYARYAHESKPAISLYMQLTIWMSRHNELHSRWTIIRTITLIDLFDHSKVPKHLNLILNSSGINKWV